MGTVKASFLLRTIFNHLPVSLKGVKENDYTMIMGYPGRTTRYLTSYGVDLATNVSNPALVKIRDKRLSIMREDMGNDMAVELQYASAYARLANYWKYFLGQTEQLKNLRILEKKQQEEETFNNWAQDNNKDLKNVMPDYQKAYAEYSPYAKHATTHCTVSWSARGRVPYRYGGEGGPFSARTATHAGAVVHGLQ